MRMVREGDWFGLYRAGWQGGIVSEAFSHPAKFARGLIRKIYEYALERSYLKEGNTVLDPFAGVALGGIDAMIHGLHWVGCELEDKFVQLGQQNIDLWNRRYGNGMLRRWGTAVILQGDSRNLVEVLEGARAEGIVASPPFAQAQSGGGIAKTGTPAMQSTGGGPSGTGGYRADMHGIDPANLGNMPTGEPPQAVIGSPPYAGSLNSEKHGIDWTKAKKDYPGRQMHNKRIALHVRHHDQRCYGRTDGQLAAMREGDVDAVIASPPWASTSACEDPNYRTDRHTSGGPLYNDYGDSNGQLAALPEGEPPQVDGLVSSPPYECSRTDQEFQRKAADINISLSMPEETKGYGDSDLGRSRTSEAQDTFWSAARAILLQCHAVLAPGGVAIWVVKDFVRNKKRVDFTGQWRALCESCGFETIEVIRAWLVEERGTQYDLMGEAHTKVVERKSFFRRLYEFNARAAKFWESMGRDDKAGYLWHAHGELWQNYHEQMLDDTRESPPPLPTRTRILMAAQALAYREAGEPDIEIDTQIDYEIVLITQKI